MAQNVLRRAEVIFHGAEDNMAQSVLRMEEVITEFRQMLPAQCATAKAIDQRQPWEQIALRAIDDGYIQFAEDFNVLIEACLRRGS